MDEVVTILVGPEEAPFHVHKALLSSKSKYFKAAFEGSFKEASEKKIRLRDEDPELFPHYILWVYNYAVELPGPDDEADFAMGEWCHLCVLAEKLGSEALQNLVMDKLCQHTANGMDRVVTAKTINFVWGATLPGSGLRKILVDLVAWQCYSDHQPDLVDATPEYLCDVLEVCTRRLPRRLRDEVAPFDESTPKRCRNYHSHRSSTACSYNQ